MKHQLLNILLILQIGGDFKKNTLFDSNKKSLCLFLLGATLEQILYCPKTTIASDKNGGWEMLGGYFPSLLGFSLFSRANSMLVPGSVPIPFRIAAHRNW